MNETIAILGGSGQQGRGLAQRLAYAGRHIVVGSRDPERARAAVASWHDASHVEVADNAAAVAQATVVILTVPFDTIAALLDGVRERFAPGTLAIDVTVPVTFARGAMSMLDVPEGSATEHVRARLPDTVRLAAAFKTIPAHLLGELDQPLDCDEFVCGDSDEARTETAELVRLVPGVRPIDVGPLTRARSIEHLTALAIAINRRHKVREARFRVVGLP
jgi:8-hydroxy-5-deazaflavin:NADPH oxidoreductase